MHLQNFKIADLIFYIWWNDRLVEKQIVILQNCVCMVEKENDEIYKLIFDFLPFCDFDTSQDLYQFLDSRHIFEFYELLKNIYIFN